MIHFRPSAGRRAYLESRREGARSAIQSTFNELRIDGFRGEGLNLRGSCSELQRVETLVAREAPGRQAQNKATGEALIDGTRRAARADAIDADFEQSDKSLADEGRAHKARAAMLLENAQKFSSISHRGAHGPTIMFSEQGARGSLTGAIHEEARGIAALEGRDGLAARTGLSGEKLDRFVDTVGAGSLLARHEKQFASLDQSAETPSTSAREQWTARAETATPEVFFAEAAKFRAQKIEELYGAPDADRDTIALGNAMRKLNQEASERGPGSSQSLRVNQRLWGDLPRDSEDKEAMTVIRSVTLQQRKEMRVANEGSR